MKKKAKWVLCAGYRENPQLHYLRDFCWTCAPYWEKIAVCPEHGQKIPMSGWCKSCRKYYDVREERNDIPAND